MKNIISMLVILFVSFNVLAAQDPLDIVGDRCAPGDVLYYGQNTKHTKEVLVCQLGGNIIYTFGKIGKDPELTVQTSFYTVISNETESLKSEYLMIQNGNTTYQVGSQTDKMINSSLDTVTVIKRGKGIIAEILLSEKTTVNDIKSLSK